MTTKKIKVSITKEDIENGKARRCAICPVSLACARALGVKFVSVTNVSLYGFYPKDDFLGNLPIRVQKFIERFDAGKKCDPFTFTLDIVPTHWFPLEQS